MRTGVAPTSIRGPHSHLGKAETAVTALVHVHPFTTGAEL